MNSTQQHKMYMDIAKRVAQESYCRRSQVGAVVVSQNRGLFVGFNGTLPGFPNQCECDDGLTTDEDITVHAEANCFDKMLAEGVSARGATLYTTLSPCKECAKRIISSKVRQVVFLEKYRITKPLDTLISAGVSVLQLTENGIIINYTPDIK